MGSSANKPGLNHLRQGYGGPP